MVPCVFPFLNNDHFTVFYEGFRQATEPTWVLEFQDHLVISGFTPQRISSLSLSLSLYPHMNMMEDFALVTPHSKTTLDEESCKNRCHKTISPCLMTSTCFWGGPGQNGRARPSFLTPILPAQSVSNTSSSAASPRRTNGPRPPRWSASCDPKACTWRSPNCRSALHTPPHSQAGRGCTPRRMGRGVDGGGSSEGSSVLV